MKTIYEYSAGGVIVDNKKGILFIKTKNLIGKTVWTFPKGHIEEKEKADETALREVKEETGYKCEIVKYLDTIQYFFKKNDDIVLKKVKWFMMKPLRRINKPCNETLKVKWIPFKKSIEIAEYSSDRKLIKKIMKEFKKNVSISTCNRT